MVQIGRWILKIEVDGQITVNDGHDVASEVRITLTEGDMRIVDAMVHVDPFVNDESAAEPS